MITIHDHATKTLEKLNDQRLAATFTDVTVTAGDRSFFLHKSLLAAHSALFSSVLRNINGYQSMPSINLDGIDPTYFASIIEFIYTSKLGVTKSNVDQLQLTAQLLQVQDVIDYCTKVKKSQTQLAEMRTVKSVECHVDTKPDTSNVEILENSQQSTSTAKMMIEVYQDETDRQEPLHASEKNARKRGRKPQSRIRCEYCNKSFTRPKYEAHMRQHTGEKLFECNVCSRKFVSPYNLKIHERVHTGERPYACKLCGKTFADPSTSRKHLLWHAGVRNNRCDICSKLFVTKTQLREHQRSHTKEKPYSCPNCSKSYRYRCDLKRHLREHSGDLFGPCEKCCKCFNHRSNFLAHLKKHKDDQQGSSKECVTDVTISQDVGTREQMC